MATNLAPVFLDNNRITLQGNPQPKVAQILEAGGRSPQGVEVVWLKNKGDHDGRHLRPEDVIDRPAQGSNPVYLKVFAGSGSTTSGSSQEKRGFTPESSRPTTPEQPMGSSGSTMGSGSATESSSSGKPGETPEGGKGQGYGKNPRNT